MFDSGDLFNWQFPFYIYDQGQTYGGYTPTHLRLGYWKFDGSLVSQEGQAPFNSPSVTYSNDWSGKALSVTETQAPEYYIESGSWQNLNWSNGTVRFWYQPNWYSTNTALPGFISLFTADGTDGNWGMFVYDSTHLVFNSGRSPFQSGNPGTPGFFELPINFQSNYWYQIALTYSPSNIALYTNGILAATAYTPIESNAVPFYDFGSGLDVFPTAPNESFGFCIGADNNGLIDNPCLGQIDEFETFNYALTPKAIEYGFPGFGGPPGTVGQDSDYDGRSDMLETNVDGTSMTSASSVAQCRLGYWRFDTADLTGEQGQFPLSSSNVTLISSWSGTALNMSSAANSHVTYPDVSSNGWANINCRQGSLRFWFKPNSSAITGGTFLYLGNANANVSQWSLNLNASSEITLLTASNSASTTCLTSGAIPFSSSKWIQIALDYGPGGTYLYTNGVLAQSQASVVLWPNSTDRARGIIIGNNISNNAPINGQIDELETFNYQLTAAQIATNFLQVKSVDSDLDGIPDLLEDIKLSTNRPFLGQPVTITGAIEAEQFDMGSNGVAYYTTNTVVNTNYRPTKMVITNCDDLGGGYCLDQTHAGEWTLYGVKVLVPQTYMVEVRAEAVGTSTGGIFQCDFTNGVGLTNVSGISNSTAFLTNSSTAWTNYSCVVYLPTNTTTMRLHFLTNAAGTNTVGRFNYVSIYPWWQAGFTTTNPSITVSQINSNNGVSTWMAATNNAYWIQNAINQVSANGGGLVQIPTGTYYVAQSVPNEANPAYQNAAVSVLSTNIAIAGNGVTNTYLVGYNRATTLLNFGQSETHGVPIFSNYTNFTLRDLTFAARPQLAVSNIANNVGNVVFDANALGYTFNDDQSPYPLIGSFVGSSVVFWYNNTTQWPNNILITNCQFVSGYNQIVVDGDPSFGISNILVVNSGFIFTNWSGEVPGNCGVFGYGVNFLAISNYFNGNSNMLVENTNYSVAIGASGLAWLQAGGNGFFARNCISNYAREGVQVDSGPNAVVDNTFESLDSIDTACALNLSSFDYPGGDGLVNPVDWSTCFVGNSITGGRAGVESVLGGPYTLNFSGNDMTLYPAFNISEDYPSDAVQVANSLSANICGNTLNAGGVGFLYNGACASALLLHNNFACAAFRGIGYQYGGYTLTNAQIYGNVLGQGVSFHAQVSPANGSGWFFKNNTFLDPNSNNVPAFLDPLSAPVHLNP